jgi:putative methyltransferase (TIGR04325 family)
MKLSRLWRKEGSPHYFTPWDDSWDEAVRESLTQNRITYGTDSVAQTERERHQSFLKTYSKEETFVDGQTQHLLAALSVILSKHQSPRLRVLDFGGSWGVYYYYVRRALPQIDLEWLIIETAPTVKALEPCAETCLHWQSTFPAPPDRIVSAADKPFDVCLANASLQHVDTVEEIVKRLAGLGRYLLLNRLPIINAPEDRLVVHRSVTNKRLSLPARLISEEKLLRLLKSCGALRLSWSVPQDVAMFCGKKVSYKGYLVETNPLS